MGRKLIEKLLLISVFATLLFYFYHEMMNMVIQNLELLVNINVTGTRASTFLLLFSLTLTFLLHNKYKIYSNYIIPVFFLWTALVLAFIFTTYGTIDLQLFRILINTIIPFLSCFYLFSLAKSFDVTKLYSNLMFISLLFFTHVFFKTFTLSNLFLVIEHIRPVTIAYFSLIALPSVLTTNSKKVKIISIAIVLIAIVLSMKRGGVVALVLSLTTYFAVQLFFISNSMSATKKIAYAILAFLLIGYALLELSNFLGHSAIDRLGTIQADGGSGRMDIYRSVLYQYANSNIFNLLLGHGYMAVLNSQVQFSAHNDFLEVLYNYGLITLCVYVAVHLSLVFFSIKLIREKSKLAAPFAMSYVQFLVFSMVSHVFYYAFFILFAMFWGFTLGTYSREAELKSATIGPCEESNS